MVNFMEVANCGIFSRKQFTAFFFESASFLGDFEISLYRSVFLPFGYFDFMAQIVKHNILIAALEIFRSYVI